MKIIQYVRYKNGKLSILFGELSINKSDVNCVRQTIKDGMTIKQAADALRKLADDLEKDVMDMGGSHD